MSTTYFSSVTTTSISFAITDFIRACNGGKLPVNKYTLVNLVCNQSRFKSVNGLNSFTIICPTEATDKFSASGIHSSSNGCYTCMFDHCAGWNATSLVY